MYSLVLATMLTTGQAAPAWGCWGCHGCCGGCWGCHGCCGGCWGCYGCYGGGYVGCWGTCYGCCCGCGGVVLAAAAPAVVTTPGVYVQPASPTLPPPMNPADGSPKKTNAAAVVIRAPIDVRISVDGQPTERTAAEETFNTPELQPGQVYQYVFKAEAMRDGKTTTTLSKRVTVEAGRQSEVDFNELASDGGADDVAKVTLRVPDDASVTVNGVRIPLDPQTQTFETPRLERGRQYFYTVKAEVVRDGRNISKDKRVFVEAGKHVTVEFKELTAEVSVRR